MKTIKIQNYLPLIFMFTIAATILLLLGIAAANADGPPAATSDIRAAVTAGQKAPLFHVKTVDGKMVNFPADYKGKVVLLDFWATWCGPCRAELPNVIAAYQKYHDKGFDVVSVSLDRPRQGPALLQFIHDHNMTWPQIYDGGYWKAAIATEYGVRAIPCPVVVDGDTGKILAVGADAVGHRLIKVLEPALAAKIRK